MLVVNPLSIGISVFTGTKISVFGTNTSENPRFSVPISVPKQNTKYAN